MKKLTSFIKESNKLDFSKKLLLKTENGVLLEAKISVKDINESFAKEQILESILGQKINFVEVLENVDFNDDVIERDIIDDNIEIDELYIPWTSVFDTAPYYQVDVIANAIKDDEDVVATYTEKQFGWSNQPEVVVVKVETKDLNTTKKRLITKLQHALQTQWVRIDKKDW